MLTHAPLPEWKTLLRAVIKKAAKPEELAAFWHREGERAGWLSRSAWSIALIAQWRMQSSKKENIIIWLPDFFCNSSLVAVRNTGAKIAFYNVDKNLFPVQSSLLALLENGIPDIIIVVHYFGKPTPATSIREFCKKHNAWLVEDAAHVFYPVTGIGSSGDFVLYSPHKHLAISDGAVLVARSNGPSQLNVAIDTFGNLGAWDKQLKGIQARMNIGDSQVAKNAWVWLLKRLLQKLGMHKITLASYLPFKESQETDSSDEAPGKFPGPGMGHMARKILTQTIPGIPAMARKKQRNQLLWDELVAATSLADQMLSVTDRPLLRQWIPYLASYTATPENAETIYNKLANLQLPVTTWPDMPPELIAEKTGFETAWQLRHSRVYLPVHPTISLKKLTAAYWNILSEGGNVSIRWIDSREEWQALFSQVGRSNFLHSWAYGEAKTSGRKWAVKRAVFLQNDEPIAIVQLLTRKIGWITITRINRGPLLMRKLSPGELTGIYKFLGNYGNLGKTRILFIAPELDLSGSSLAILHKSHFHRFRNNSWESIWIDLTKDIDGLRKQLDGKWRNMLSFAEKSNLALEMGNDDTLFNWMIDRYRELTDSKQFQGPAVELLYDVRKAQSGNESFLVLKGSFENRAIAGICIAIHGNAATYLIGWNGAEGRTLKANQFLLWSAVKYLKDRNISWFDLGGISEEKTPGISAFKKGLNGEIYELAGEFIK